MDGASNTGQVSDLVRFQRWRKARNLLFWLFFPVMVVTSYLFSLVTRYSPFVIWIAWVVLYLYVAWRVSHWPCPNCGKQVMVKGRFHNDFSSKCLHCGFALKLKPLQKL
jgi:hypothetical protein